LSSLNEFSAKPLSPFPPLCICDVASLLESFLTVGRTFGLAVSFLVVVVLFFGFFSDTVASQFCFLGRVNANSSVSFLFVYLFNGWTFAFLCVKAGRSRLRRHQAPVFFPPPGVDFSHRSPGFSCLQSTSFSRTVCEIFFLSVIRCFYTFHVCPIYFTGLKEYTTFYPPSCLFPVWPRAPAPLLTSVYATTLFFPFYPVC